MEKHTIFSLLEEKTDSERKKIIKNLKIISSSLTDEDFKTMHLAMLVHKPKLLKDAETRNKYVALVLQQNT